MRDLADADLAASNITVPGAPKDDATADEKRTFLDGMLREFADREEAVKRDLNGRPEAKSAVEYARSLTKEK